MFHVEHSSGHMPYSVADAFQPEYICNFLGGAPITSFSRQLRLQAFWSQTLNFQGSR
jgi:hypothetical protein